MCSVCTIRSHVISFQPFLTSFAIFHAFTDFLSQMFLKLKSTTNELWKGWNLAWYHHFTHIACAKKMRGLRQKLDPLRVQNGQSLSKYQCSDENSSVTKAFHFFKLISTPDFLCVQYAPFVATSSIFDPFLTSFAIFHAFHDLFWAKWPWNWQALQMNSEKVEI